MNRLRTYGAPPFTVAVLHGGPGAPGTMAPVARELSARRGVLEPLQTEHSVDGQVEELAAVLRLHATLPAAIVGSSWGAMLGYILAARQPELVSKLILVGSGPYEARYAAGIDQTRLNRLSESQRQEVQTLLQTLEDPAPSNRNVLFARLGHLLSTTDAYDPLPDDGETMDFSFEIYRRVWGEAARLRASGELLTLGRQIHCPVVAIHGEYDPHPAEGVYEPLSRVVADFRIVILPVCGHLPWLERQAKNEFYRVLESELENTRYGINESPLSRSQLHGWDGADAQSLLDGE